MKRRTHPSTHTHLPYRKEEVIALLLSHRADKKAKALLYDGETPVQLARRFGRGEKVIGLLLC